MGKLYRSVYIYGLLSAVLLGGAGCHSANTRAEETTAGKDAVKIEAEFEAEPPPPLKKDSTENAEPQISAASIAGTYDYDTHRDGEGYDNSLEIKHAGADKLYVYLSGSYIYKVGETQTFKEAEGKGDATLSGNRASATLVDEAGKPCRATITFKPAEAAVVIPDTCQFNIRLGGIYKRVSGKTSETKKSSSSQIREVSYDELMDFVNDFDRHQPGARYVVKGVPANKFEKQIRADEFGNQSYKNLFYLEENDPREDYSHSPLLTSKAMVESLAREVEHEPLSLRLTAVLVESRGKFDVYRMSFVTKIEGLNDDGSVMWTATGGEPAKVKFTH